MALQKIHADLQSSLFPFNFSELSSCVVIDTGGEVQRKTPASFVGEAAEQQAGIPQAYYMENVLPTARGYSSVHYTPVVPAIPDIEGEVIAQFEMWGESSGLALMAITHTRQYVFDAIDRAWKDVTIISNPNSTIYVANVKDACYVFAYGAGLYRYDFSLKQLVEVEALGVEIGNMQGMTASGAILVFWDVYNRIYWSSILDPLDFVPSLSTGAGSISVLAITTKITTCEALGKDFIIYTKNNAIAARATGDVQFPFVFNEIPGSEGAYLRDHVASNTNSDTHIVWTGLGFQELNSQRAQYIWEELRDGISKGYLIQLDALMERPRFSYVQKLDIKVSFCSNNFLAVSLKSPAEFVYKEAYIFDRTLRRWGRVVVDHQTLFANPIVPILGVMTYGELEELYPTYADIDTATPPLHYFDIDADITPDEGPQGVNFGVIGFDGRVHMGAYSETSEFRGTNEGINAAVPRIFLGRYKLIRDQGIAVRGLMIRGLINGRLNLHGHSYTGDYIRKYEKFTEQLTHPGYYTTHCVCDSVSAEVWGTFNLTDLQIEYTTTGTAKQYGVPVRKKFYSYINSAPYPVFSTEELQSDVAAANGELYPWTFQEIFRADASLIHAELRQPVVMYSASENISSDAALVFGELRPTIVNVYLTVDDDKLTTATTLVDGSLEQIIFNVYHKVYDVDTVIPAVSLVSGSLTR